jgi:hypothetical protein
LHDWRLSEDSSDAKKTGRNLQIQSEQPPTGGCGPNAEASEVPANDADGEYMIQAVPVVWFLASFCAVWSSGIGLRVALGCTFHVDAYHDMENATIKVVACKVKKVRIRLFSGIL